MVIGSGTGSTADFFIIALADALRTGPTRDIGVPTSVSSGRAGWDRWRRWRCPLSEVTVDGHEGRRTWT
jgi:ribose 5-phosphate isomerase